MTDISIIDSSFDIGVTTSYYMSIQANLNGLCFCILDPVTNKYVLFEYKSFKQPDLHQTQLEEQLITNQYFNRTYKKVMFLYQTDCFALVPTPLFSDDYVKDILEFNGCQPTAEDHLVTNKINMCDSVNVFAIPRFLYHTLKNQFPEIRFLHQSTPIIESALLRKKSLSEFQFLITLQDHSFEIIATHKHHLKLCNTFQYSNEKDLIYLILFTFEQLGLSMNQTYIEISGAISSSDTKYVQIKRYLKNAVLAPLPPHFLYSEAIHSLESHRFANLFNLTLCV